MASISKKFIPNGDPDFSDMAWRFAQSIAADSAGPRKYCVDQEDSVALTEAVAKFRGALQKARGGGRRSGSPIDTAAKDAARKDAERIIRRIAGAIRSNPDLDAASKALLGIKVASKKRGRANLPGVPQESPVVVFTRAIHRSVHVPEHELAFAARDGKRRPEGAARLELFVELVPPDAPVPSRPGGSVSSGGGLHYLRSYVRSPIVLVPPMPDRPMRVVYWGRWADGSGNVGPYSAAAAGWVECGSHHLMGPVVPGGAERPKLIHVADAAASGDEVDTSGGTRVMVAVMQTQQRFLEVAGERAGDAPPQVVEASRDAKQLAGPTAEYTARGNESLEAESPQRDAA